jgi:hypothetical protein
LKQRREELKTKSGELSHRQAAAVKADIIIKNIADIIERLSKKAENAPMEIKRSLLIALDIRIAVKGKS